MKQSLFIIILLVSVKIWAQPLTLKGVVTQHGTNIVLPGATAQILETNQGTSSNADGCFTFGIAKKGVYTLRVSFIGYAPFEDTVNINSNISVSVALTPEETQLTEVTVLSNKNSTILSHMQAGTQKLTIKDIKMLPTFMGDNDPIKALRLTPGVQAGGEGNEGLFVRGSDPGQNLTLLEDLPIYNASHLLGLYSVFNPSIIKNITLYKGAYPSLYGGKASSLLKIGLTDGIPDKTEVEGSVGYISSRASVRIPLLRHNASLLMGGRFTSLQTLRPVFNLLNSEDNYLENNMYQFNDLNARLEVSISKKDRLIVNSYSGADNYKLLHSSSGVTNKMYWGNRAATIKQIHTFSPTCSWSNTLGITTYFFNLNAHYEQYSLKLNSELVDPFFRSEMYLSLPKHFIQVGTELTLHNNKPESTNVKIDESEYLSNLRFRSGEISVFINDTYELSPNTTISAGVRTTAYTHLGKYNRYLKDAAGTITDTLHYGFNEPVKTYYGIAPRLSANIKLSENSTYKISLSRSYQYIHLISVGSVSLPTDIWFPSTFHVKPEFTDQVAMGYGRVFNAGYEASIDLYFKKLNNVIEFKNSLMANYSHNEFEENIIHGEGYSYGAEWHCKKNVGKVTGWVSYTLAWSIRKFDEINNGKPYFGKYDRRHDLAITAQYQLSKHWSLSSVIIYSTGNAMTLPTGRYMIQGNIINDYTSVNAFRMPAYHRMDIAATYTRKVNNKFESSWNFSIYNLYNRANPYYVFLEAEGKLEDYKLSVKAKKIALFPILPSVSWSFKF